MPRVTVNPLGRARVVIPSISVARPPDVFRPVALRPRLATSVPFSLRPWTSAALSLAAGGSREPRSMVLRSAVLREVGKVHLDADRSS